MPTSSDGAGERFGLPEVLWLSHRRRSQSVFAMTRMALLSLLFVACGDDSGVRILDDAPLLDGPAGNATVTVTVGGAPRANRPVIFQGPDGAEIAIATTGADGKVSANVPAGSSVTTLDLYNTGDDRRSIATVMGVMPGDSIVFNGEEFTARTATFQLPAHPDTGAIYIVETTCGRTSDGVTTTTVQLELVNCPSRIDTVAYAANATAFLGYIALLDQPSAGPIDLTAQTWQALTTVQSTYTNLPNMDNELSDSTRSLHTSRGRFADCLTIDSTDTVADHLCPVIPNTFAVDDSFFFNYPVGEYAITQLATAASQTFDLAETKLRNATDGATWDATTRTLTWEETATGGNPQFTSVVVGSDLYSWEVLAPYTPGRLVLPPLLGEAAMYNEAENVNAYYPKLGTATGGYDALRPHGTRWERLLGNDIARIVLSGPYSG
jgi:hypothetical protein